MKLERFLRFGENHALMVFCEKFVELSEFIVFADQESMNEIENNENEVKKNIALGIIPPMYRGLNNQQITIRFLCEKINIVANNLVNNRGLNRVVNELNDMITKNPNFVRQLKLYVNSNSINNVKDLARQIYVNYYCVKERVEALRLEMDDSLLNKKGG